MSFTAESSRRAYVTLLAGSGGGRWWDAVVLTASSERQAEGYRAEIDRRLAAGHLPAGARYLVVADRNDSRMGSGSATIHALGALWKLAGAEPGAWWREHRVLMIHSGGDSRRLPQYSSSGKLFGVLPFPAPWGEASTIFDETMALSAEWAAAVPPGLLVGSGDVLLTFDARTVDWRRAEVTAVAMLQRAEVGTQHGVYAIDGEGRVYRTLQKPSRQQLEMAGALFPDDRVALDTGLLWFDSSVAARLTLLADTLEWPVIDLYEQGAAILAGQWKPASGASELEQRLAAALEGVRFRCALVEGQFTHIGTTRHFRKVASDAGGMIDSVIDRGAHLEPDAVVLECDLEGPLRAGKGSVVHGLAGLTGALEIPDDTVVHQLPVHGDGVEGVAIRVYGVDDNPKVTQGVTWFGRPAEKVFEALGIRAASVWPGVAEEARSLWNARLFPVGTPEQAWRFARWMMGYASPVTAREWERSPRISLAQAAALTDHRALDAARRQRTCRAWSRTAAQTAMRGADIQPLLANPPALSALADTARQLQHQAGELAQQGATALPSGTLGLTEAASRYKQAAAFFLRAGLAAEAEAAEREAFACVAEAVAAGVGAEPAPSIERWCARQSAATAPARIDLGGGWSDTPPFCLDWGGCVLNIAVRLRGADPVRTRVRRIEEPVVRCLSGASRAEFRDSREVCGPAAPGDWTSIPRLALQLLGVREGKPLRATLAGWGGGIEIDSEVRLPVGSGLGASSILAATVLQAVAALAGIELTHRSLSDLVLRLEQLMTSGGGWQDQAGGIWGGAKLLLSSPGAVQRVRVHPISWTPEREAEFASRVVLYDTGIQRIAKNLLQQVVGSYLLRETSTVQVLHSIKTLASEMAHALSEGEWSYLGDLLNRHWELNKRLDPNTTNAPIEAILTRVKPLAAGAKLAGAGGGGFLILLAHDPAAAVQLRTQLGPRCYPLEIAPAGLRVSTTG